MSPTMNVVMLAALAAAPEGSAGLLEARGAEYLQARAVALEAPARAEDAPKLDAETWRRVVLQEALRAHRADPGLAARTLDVPGVRPEVYRRARRPEPSATHDVARWPAAVVLEHLAFVGRVDRAPEAFAVRHSVILAAGRSGHPAARFALAEVLADPAEPIALRAAAAEGLGLTGDTAAVPVLAAVVEDSEAPVSLREAALAGLGGLRASASLDVLEPWVDSDRGPASRVAIAAVGRLGSARLATPALSGRAAAILARALGDAELDAKPVIEALARTAHAPTVATLAALAEGPELDPALRERYLAAADRMQRVLRRRARAARALSR